MGGGRVRLERRSFIDECVLASVFNDLKSSILCTKTLAKTLCRQLMHLRAREPETQLLVLRHLNWIEDCRNYRLRRRRRFDRSGSLLPTRLCRNLLRFAILSRLRRFCRFGLFAQEKTAQLLLQRISVWFYYNSF